MGPGRLLRLARVLSRDPFWVSIRGSATHPLHAQLEAGMAGVFASERGLASEWMTGRLSSDQVIAEMGIHLDRRFRDDFLGRRLDLDCARMRVNAELFEVLRVMRAEAVVVIVEGPRSMEEKSAAGRGFLAAATSGDAARGSPVAGIDRSSCAGSGVWSIRTPTGSERERAA